ncbi:MAG: RHS repeat-associated core domain-containing protein [Weeksellaceae bacterium]
MQTSFYISFNHFAGTQRVASKPEGKAGIFNTSPLHGYEELKIRQLGDAQAVADTVDLGIITMGGPIEEPVNPDVYYFHPDHLGTSTMISDGSGYAYQFFLNLPFGANERKSHAVFLEVCERSSMAEQRRSGSFDNPYKFNGKELDEETGLYYYGARHYNPRISNWLSVDPIALWQPVQEIEHYIEGQHNDGYFNPKNMSVYGYTYQNPIRYIDPNGKQVDVVVDKIKEIWNDWSPFNRANQRMAGESERDQNRRLAESTMKNINGVAKTLMTKQTAKDFVHIVTSVKLNMLWRIYFITL